MLSTGRWDPKLKGNDFAESMNNIQRQHSLAHSTAILAASFGQGRSLSRRCWPGGAAGAVGTTSPGTGLAQLCLPRCGSRAGRTPWQWECIPCALSLHPLAKVSLQAPPDSLMHPTFTFDSSLHKLIQRWISAPFSALLIAQVGPVLRHSLFI